LSFLFLFLLVCYGLIVLLWIWGMVWMRGFGTDAEMQISPLPDAEFGPTAPRLAVFIAAHNEEDNIGSCLDRLLSQNYGNLRITVVNDRSDDATGERARAIMAEDPSGSLNLVEIDDLPEGWIGKTHALAVAAQDVDADYLLFMDCDCRLAPGAIAGVMRKVIDEDLEFASLWPRLELLSPSERLITPAASWLLGLWALLAAKRGSRNSEVIHGNGQFMMFSKSAYERVGGHASVKAELAEDLAIAEKVAALGLRRWAGLGKGLFVTSRANRLSGTVNSLTRVLIGSLVKPWRILVSTQLLLGGVVLPVWVLPVSLYLAWTTGAPICWAFVVLCVLHVAAMHYVVRRLLAMTLEDSPSSLSFVFGCVLAVGVLVWSWVVITGRGHVRWGNTAYRVRGSRIVGVLSEAGPSSGGVSST
jgi:hypothetical protein